ncbi:MAG: sensor histidine kinase [Hydrogenovibrio sp.]
MATDYQVVCLTSAPYYRDLLGERFQRYLVVCDDLAELISRLVQVQLSTHAPLLVFLDDTLLLEDSRFSLLKRLHELSPTSYFVVDFSRMDEEDFRFYQEATHDQIVWLVQDVPKTFALQLIEQALRGARQAIETRDKREQHRQAVAKLRNQNALFNDLIGWVQFDVDGRVLNVNRRFSDETGWTLVQVLGHSIHEIVLWSNDEEGDGLYHEDFIGETRYFDAKGQQKWAFAYVKKWQWNDQPVLYYVANDITAWKRQRRQRQFGTYQEGLLKAKSELIHDIGNTLNSMNASQSRLEDGMRQLSETLMYLKHWMERQKEVGTGPKTFLDFLDALIETLQHTHEMFFSQGGAAFKHGLDQMIELVNREQQGLQTEQYTEIVNLYNLIQELVKSNQALLREKSIRMEVLDMNTSIFLKVSRNQLYQVLLNLVKNAIEAIDVSTKPERLITVQTFQKPDEVRLIVHDSGDGIAEAHRNKIFNYGFTTKPKGSGHGLHSLANFMDACHGKIEVTSSHENGTSFILVFPTQ